MPNCEKYIVKCGEAVVYLGTALHLADIVLQSFVSYRQHILCMPLAAQQIKLPITIWCNNGTVEELMETF